MESANTHHLHDQLVGSSSNSSSTNPTCYGVGTTTTTHTNLIPYNSMNNANGFSQNTTSTQISTQQHEINTNTPLFCSSPYMNFNMSPDSGFINHQSEIKEEFSDNYGVKYTDMFSSSPSSITTDDNTNDFTTKLLLKSLSSGNHVMNTPVLPHSNSSRIFPSVNVSSSFERELENVPNAGGSFDMNLQELDLLSFSRFGGRLINSSAQNQNAGFRDGLSYGFNHMRHSDEIPLFMTSDKISAPSSNGNAEAKRTRTKMDHSKSHQSTGTAPKKSRVETRVSSPPFKVRKEKLGDRIAALQQMVAPFGKTDTASVLMEAIGYIKFLHDQVETLSVSYMKASRNKISRVMKGVASENRNHEETKRDLKSRGLCLVPLTCLSYINGGGSASVWPPPHFGGPT